MTELDLERMVLVGGTGRSGSTIVGHLLDHHPDLTLGYRWVVAVLTTHVSRGITQRDLDLAEALDQLYLDHI